MDRRIKGVGFSSLELWCIVGFLFFAGVATGFALGQWYERRHTEQLISEATKAHTAAMAATHELVNRCMLKSEEAARLAANAMKECP